MAFAIIAALWGLGLGTAAQAQTTTFNSTGAVQTFTAPSTGFYDISASGAQGGSSGAGGSGGLGATVGGIFFLTGGTVLDVVVGGAGTSFFATGGSGGGGSFVYSPSFTTLYAVAGGGGGANGGNGGNGLAGTSGGDSGSGGAGGTSGSGGGSGSGAGGGGGGGGWLTAGATDGSANSGSGGSSQPAFNGGSGTGANGGFGGGAGNGGSAGGGGGGYSGGGGGNSGNFGGGGGSFLAANAVRPVAAGGVQTGNGVVMITQVDANGILANVGVGSGPAAVALNPLTNTIYVANATAGTVSVIDGATSNVLSTPMVGSNPTAIAVNPVTNTIYAANTGSATVSIINGATNLVTGTPVPVGNSPSAIAVNPVTNAIYVANSADGTVSVINPGANTVTPVVVGTNPSAVAVNPATNQIYVANSGSSNLTQIDGASNTPTSITLSSAPNLIAINPVTNTIYTAAAGSNIITALNGGTEAMAMISVGTAGRVDITALAVNPATNQLYALDQISSAIDIIDGATNTVLPVPVGSVPTSLSINAAANQIFVANSGDGSTTVIDGSTGVASILMPSPGASSGTNTVAVNPITNLVYSISNMSGQVTVASANANSVATVKTGVGPVAAAINSVTGQVFVPSQDGILTVIDGAGGPPRSITLPLIPGPTAVNSVTNTVYSGDPDGLILVTDVSSGRTTMLQGEGPQVAVAVNEITNTAYFLNSDATVDIVDGQTLTVTNINFNPNPPSALTPYAIAINEITNQIYVTSLSGEEGGYVTDIDGATNSATSILLASGTVPVALAINPATNTLYLASNNNNQVAVIPCALTVMGGATFYIGTPTAVAVGSTPLAVGVNPATNTIYVANSGDDTVTVIDGANQSTRTLPLGTGAAAVAVNAATNQAYIGSPASNGLNIIDGATNTITFVNDGAAVSALVINPLTNGVYALDANNNAVEVLAPAAASSVNLATLITPLPANTTTDQVTDITLTAANLYGPTPQPIEGIYYQLDSLSGPWRPALPGSANSTGTAALAGLTVGWHTLYAFAIDGMETASINVGPGASLIPGQVAAYSFLAEPSSFSFPASAFLANSSDPSVTITVQRNFTDAATINYQTFDGTGIAGTNYISTQGTLTFAPGQTTQTFTVPLITQELTGAAVSFSVALSTPSGTAIIGSPATASVVVLNDNSEDVGLSLLTPTTPSSAGPATASLTVNLTASDGSDVGQWLLLGQPTWQASGAAITGLIAGNYNVEFQTVPGYLAPPTQVVPISAGAAVTITGNYTATMAAQLGGSLSVTIAPAGTGGWQLAGDPAGVYHKSGDMVPNLLAGAYIVVFEPVAGLAAPSNLEAIVQANAPTIVQAAYLMADSTMGQTPSLVTSSLLNTPPYEFVGQIVTDSGSGTGFVPLDRIVLTAAEVIFNEGSLSYSQGVQWLFQEETGSFEAPPLIPRGIYLSGGYAAQRADENTPGVLSQASQQLDFATLYFYEPTARGGQSGYLASDSSANSWLTGSRSKLITGYPIDVNFPVTAGELYATPIVQSALQFVSGGLFETTALTGYGGTSGGPLCVQFDDGIYYPAAIYLGGTTETTVRSIDGQVIDLMTRAEVSGNGGANNVGGGVIVVNAGITGTTAFALGSLTINLGPAGAVAAGGRWELSDHIPRGVGDATTALGLAPGAYPVTFSEVAGYTAPSTQTVAVTAGAEAFASASYTPNVVPTITSKLTAIATMSLSFQYQIDASFDPISYSIASGALPAGLTLNSSSGLISGIPSAMGIFTVGLKATNAKGPSTPVTLNLTVAPPGQLSVAISPAQAGSVPKAFTGKTIHGIGSSLTVTATPAAGFLFDQWSNADTGAFLSSSTAYEFTMPQMLDLQANFVPNPFTTAKGSYFALIQGGTYAQSGSLQITVSALGSFTAAFTLGGETHTIANHFSDQGQFSAPIVFPNGASYTVALNLTAAGVLTGILTNAIDQSELSLAAAPPAAAPKALLGSYTAQLPLAAPASNLPAGYGYGTMIVAKSGVATVTGFLGDGTRMHVTGSGDSQGEWAFYFAKAATKTTGAELVLGTITPTAPAGYTGTLAWFREPNANDPLYKTGFTTAIAFTAAAYKAPAASFTAASVTFSGGNLNAPVVIPITISSKDIVTAPSGPTGFTLKLTAATGLFTGSFPEAAKDKPAFNGAILQLQSGPSGEGLFQESNGLIGSVLIQPTP